jgi:hypothetical protein
MDYHESRIKRILGVSDGRVFPANRASSGAPNESTRSSATRRGLLYLLVSFEFERPLDAAIAVRQWSVRLEEMCDLFRNRHAIIVPSRKSKSPSLVCSRRVCAARRSACAMSMTTKSTTMIAASFLPTYL